jgi:hypothetical protein
VNSSGFKWIQPKKQKKTQKRPVHPAGNSRFPLLKNILFPCGGGYIIHKSICFVVGLPTPHPDFPYCQKEDVLYVQHGSDYALWKLKLISD